MTILATDIQEKFNRDSHDTYWEIDCYDFNRHSHHKIYARPKTRFGKPIKNYRANGWDVLVDHLNADCFVECGNVPDSAIESGEGNPNRTYINGDYGLERLKVIQTKSEQQDYLDAVRQDKRDYPN